MRLVIINLVSPKYICLREKSLNTTSVTGQKYKCRNLPTVHGFADSEPWLRLLLSKLRQCFRNKHKLLNPPLQEDLIGLRLIASHLAGKPWEYPCPFEDPHRLQTQKENCLLTMARVLTTQFYRALLSVYWRSHFYSIILLSPFASKRIGMAAVAFDCHPR